MPSASMSSGLSHLSRSSRTMSCPSSYLSIPMPTARAVNLSPSFSSFSTPNTDSLSSPGRGRLISSTRCPSKVGFSLSGTATVTSPLPVLVAARADITTAPVLPTLPPIMRTCPSLFLYVSGSLSGSFRPEGAITSLFMLSARRSGMEMSWTTTSPQSLAAG